MRECRAGARRRRGKRSTPVSLVDERRGDMLDRWSDDLSDLDDEGNAPSWCIGNGSSFHDQNPSSGI